jgi:hypothetical protein
MGTYDDYAPFIRRNVVGNLTNISGLSQNTGTYHSSMIGPLDVKLFWGSDTTNYEHHKIVTCKDGQQFQWSYSDIYPTRATKIVRLANGISTDMTQYFLENCDRLGTPGSTYVIGQTTYTLEEWQVVYPNASYISAIRSSPYTASAPNGGAPAGWQQQVFWQGEYSFVSEPNPQWQQDSLKTRPSIVLNESYWHKFGSSVGWDIGNGALGSDGLPLGGANVTYGYRTSYARGAGISWTHSDTFQNGAPLSPVYYSDLSGITYP